MFKIISTNKAHAQTDKILFDDLLPLKDRLAYTYHYIRTARYEYRIQRLEDRQERHQKAKRDLIDIFNAIHDLQDL